MAIHQFPERKQPREKLVSVGAANLSDIELLAIFLRTGTKGKNVILLSEQLLEHFGSLNAVFSASFEQFNQVKGIGIAKFVQFQAALELSKRYLGESMMESTVLDSPSVVRSYLHQSLKSERYEQFILIHLDNQHRVLKQEVLFKGTIDSAAVYPRVVVDSVIRNNSAAVIFAHNHPSGNPEPSQADVQLTKKLKQALSYIDVRTLDHFIIGYQEVVSLAERGLM